MSNSSRQPSRPALPDRVIAVCRAERPRLLPLAALVLATLVMLWGNAAAAQAVPIDTDIQAIKKDAVDLNRELAALEEELLFPAGTQVSVFLSLDVGAFFRLESVQVKIDDREVANHLYSERDINALEKGGAQRLYLGNLLTGEHELLAIFTGKGPDGRDYRRGASVKFTKDGKAKFLELRISDRQRSGQPEFEIRDWD